MQKLMCACVRMRICIYNGGVLCIVVIVTGNGISDLSSNPGQSNLYFTSC